MANLVRSGVTESEVGVGGHSHGQNPVRGGSGTFVYMVQNDAGTTRLLLPKGPKTFEPCQMAAHTLEGMYEECFDALKA